MKAVVAAALVVLSPPPPVCLPRAQLLLAAGSDYNAARGAGRSGLAASLLKIMDRGEAATLEEAQLVLSRQGHAATLRNMVKRGEVATLEEGFHEEHLELLPEEVRGFGYAMGDDEDVA